MKEPFQGVTAWDNFIEFVESGDEAIGIEIDRAPVLGPERSMM